MEKALGLVETKGLVGAIEAADAMAKAADVKIFSKERTDPAMITIKCVGEVAAVKAAVEAGAAAAQRVGQLISVLVIPRPDDQVDFILTAKDKKNVVIDGVINTDKKSSTKQSSNKKETSKVENEKLEDDTQEAVTVDVDKIDLANLKYEEVEKYNTATLRKLIRKLELPNISGKEISYFNKTKLLEILKEHLEKK